MFLGLESGTKVVASASSFNWKRDTVKLREKPKALTTNLGWKHT